MPRLLYLLQALPIKLPQTFFHAVRSKFIKFLWRGRHPRIGRALLLRLKMRGGISFPHPALYYTATHMTRVVDWCRHVELKFWVSLEQEMAWVPLAGLPWVGKQLDSHITTHPLLCPTLDEMEIFSRLSTLTNFPSPMTPIIGHPRFLPGLSDPAFTGQAPKRLLHASQFLRPTGWIPTGSLVSGQTPITLDSWRARQLSRFLGSLPKHVSFSWQLHSLEELCLVDGPICSSLSRSYKTLLDMQAITDPPFLAKWERDLQTTFTTPQKECIYFFVHKSSLCSKYQEITYKLTKRWYRTPSVLVKIQYFPINLIVAGIVSNKLVPFLIFSGSAPNYKPSGNLSSDSSITTNLYLNTS